MTFVSPTGNRGRWPIHASRVDNATQGAADSPERAGPGKGVTSARCRVT